MRMTTALVTGATAGIGKGFAEALAAEGHDLILVARHRDRLESVASDLSARHGVATETMAADVGEAASRGRVEDRLRDRNRPIGILVNNAGFGVNQPFVGGDLWAEQQMLNVLVVAPMRFTHAVAPVMVEHGGGAIVNVSSIAGWVTGSTYSAAKAWVTTFTESLSVELKGTGVTATAVCPGYVRTEFHDRAGMDMSSIPDWLWLSVEDVVAQALKDAKRGRPISVTGPQYQALSLAAQYAPRPLVRRMVGTRAMRR